MRQSTVIARDLARWVRREYPVSDRATWEELLAVAAARGIRVMLDFDLEAPGYYLPWPEKVIALAGMSAHVLAHELLHDLLWGESGAGVVYGFPGFGGCGKEVEEEAAQEFAELLCGPWFADFWDPAQGRRRE